MNTETASPEAAGRKTLTLNKPVVPLAMTPTPPADHQESPRPHPGAPRPGAYGDVNVKTTGTPPAEARATRVAQFKGRAPKLTAGDLFCPADQRRTVHLATPEGGTSLEQVLRPEFWAHVAAKLRPLDLIEINPKDGVYFAVLQVRSASRIEAVCEKIQYVEFGPVSRLAQSEEKAFYTRYGSPAVGWQVLRAVDKQMVKENFIDERQAQEWLDGHLKSLAA